MLVQGPSSVPGVYLVRRLAAATAPERVAGGTALGLLMVALSRWPGELATAAAIWIPTGVGLGEGLYLLANTVARRRSPLREAPALVHAVRGREKDVEVLSEYLHEPFSLVNVFGLSGIGKTTVAVEAIRRSRLKVIWIGPGDPLNDYSRLFGNDDGDLIARADRVRERLEGGSWKGVLVVDGVGPGDRILPLLPRRGRSHVVVISDVPLDLEGFERMSVLSLAEPHAAQMVLDRVEVDEAAARELGRVLGGHPRALDQSAKLIASGAMTPESLMREIHEFASASPKRQRANARSVFPYRSRLDRFRRRDEESGFVVEVLRLCGGFVHKASLVRLCGDSGAMASMTALGIMDDLANDGLIEESSAGTYSRILGLEPLDSVSDPQKGLALARVCIEEVVNGTTPEARRFCLRYFAAFLGSHQIDVLGEEAESLALEVRDVEFMFDSEAADELAAIRAVLDWVDDAETLNSLLRPALKLAHDLGDYEGARGYAEVAMRRRSELPSLSGDCAWLHLGASALDINAHLKRHVDNVVIVKRIEGDVDVAGHHNCASKAGWLYQLGMNQMARKRWDEASESLSGCLDVERVVYGEDHWRCGFTCLQLGRIAEHQGETDRAFEHFQEAARVANEVEGIRSVQILKSTGYEWARLGFDSRAGRAFLEAAEYGHSEGDFGEAARAFFEVGDIHHAKGEFAEAFQMFAEAHQFALRTGHADLEDVYWAKLNMVAALVPQKKLNPALRLLDDARALEPSLPGLSRNMRAKQQLLRGMLLISMGYPCDAVDELKQARSGFKPTNRRDYLDVRLAETQLAQARQQCVAKQ